MAFAIIILALLALCSWYVNDYSHADDTALACFSSEAARDSGIEVETLDDGSIAFVPSEPKAGLVFYPGAKVQPEAYAPLMTACAQRGIASILIKPPFNLALLDVNAADGALQASSEIPYWIAAGHSMGGVAACEYVAGHPGSFDAIALLASYPAADLSSFDGPVATVYGSNDHVLNMSAYQEAKAKLPGSTVETIIAGGNHAGFGNYGDQDNDGTAEISQSEQQEQAAQIIADLCP